MSEDVVARLEISGNHRRCGEVVGNQGIGNPGRAAHNGTLAEFGPTQATSSCLACVY